MQVCFITHTKPKYHIGGSRGGSLSSDKLPFQPLVYTVNAYRLDIIDYTVSPNWPINLICTCSGIYLQSLFEKGGVDLTYATIVCAKHAI